MEQAYSAALERVGGLEAAKPKALLTLLAPQFPQLTLEVCPVLRAAGKRGQALRSPTWQSLPPYIACTFGFRRQGALVSSFALPSLCLPECEVAPGGPPPPDAAAQAHGASWHRAPA